VPRKCTSVYRFGLAFFGRFVGIVQAIIFILQLIVFGIQAWKLDQTVKAAAQQGSDMKRSIDEATRAANAMEISAKAATVASQAAAQSVALLPKQMRAYLSVRIGGGVYQDRAANLRFEVTPMLINTGLTPVVERPHRHPKGSRSAPNFAADSARRKHRDRVGLRRDNPPGRRTFPANECPSDAQSDNAARRRGNRDSPTLQRGSSRIFQ
jgi:hypothetical protein